MDNDSNKTREKLQDILEDRKLKHNINQIESLVEALEDDESLRSFYGENYQIFCKAYLISLFKNKEYVHSIQDQEILLAVYGFLDGYKDIGIEERRRKYVEEASEFDDRIKSTWQDANKSLRNIEKEITEKLIEKLIKKMFNCNKQRSFLGLTTKVSKELSCRFPDGLPKKLPLPVPQYLHEKNSDLKNHDDGNNEKATDININSGNAAVTEATTNKNDEDQDSDTDEIDINPDDELDNPDNDLKDKIIIDNNISWLKNGALHNVWNKPWKMFLMFLIVLTIIIPIAYKDKNIDKKEDEEFREMIPESVLNGIQDTNIDSGEWEYFQKVDGKIFKKKVSVACEEVTEEFEPDE